jgi:hypothetical protein
MICSGSTASSSAIRACAFFVSGELDARTMSRPPTFTSGKHVYISAMSACSDRCSSRSTFSK